MNKCAVIAHTMQTLGSYHKRKTTVHSLPTYFWIEPTNHCNLRCIMCPTGMEKVTIEKGYMSYELYKKIINDIKDFASAITLAVSGESMLHPHFFDMIRYATDCGIKVLLNTNATLLDKEKALLMLDSGVASISFAFDGFTKEMYEKARVGASFEHTLENILYFLRRKKELKHRKPYTILSVLMLGIAECSERERHSFIKQFDGLLDEVRLREVSTWGNTFKDTEDFSFRKNVQCYPPCSRLWGTSVIAWNGNVVPCIYNANQDYVLGNLGECSFKDIWNGEKMKKLRTAMVDGSYLSLLSICEHCIVLGTPPLCGIPSGLRLTLADAMTNIFGYQCEKYALRAANFIRQGKFSSITIK
ncbi:MAG: radical SAM protein [Candidatus Omnitrophica bacterium]|nr:radical SAM protein [Candidatus Omnitrophota bacterium]